MRAIAGVTGTKSAQPIPRNRGLVGS